MESGIAANGYMRIPGLVSPSECADIQAMYDDETTRFRSIINMSKFNFGRGEYRYFDYPLPAVVRRLRATLYERLAPLANRWDRSDAWPARIDDLTQRCHEQGQARPTPLLLRYGAGDYNCLHQDLYGDIRFPLQVVILLNRPGVEFEGGELVLVEQRVRRQSKPVVVPLDRGDAAVIPVAKRPERSARGTRNVTVRHGVSEVSTGHRVTLGLIFHDAR